MEACLSIKVEDPDWLTCKKCLLGGHGKVRRTVNLPSNSRSKLSHCTLKGRAPLKIESYHPMDARCNN